MSSMIVFLSVMAFLKIYCR